MAEGGWAQKRKPRQGRRRRCFHIMIIIIIDIIIIIVIMTMTKLRSGEQVRPRAFSATRSFSCSPSSDHQGDLWYGWIVLVRMKTTAMMTSSVQCVVYLRIRMVQLGVNQSPIWLYENLIWWWYNITMIWWYNMTMIWCYKRGQCVCPRMVQSSENQSLIHRPLTLSEDVDHNTHLWLLSPAYITPSSSRVVNPLNPWIYPPALKLVDISHLNLAECSLCLVRIRREVSCPLTHSP